MSDQIHINDEVTTSPINSFAPMRLLAILTITVFVVELVIMVGIEFFISPESSVLLNVVEAVFDATVLAIVVFPMLYRYSFRPLVLYIADHQRIEKALGASNALLENTFASMRDIVLVVSVPDYSVITCNQAVQAILGYACHELVGHNLASLYDNPADYAAFLQTADGVFEDGRFYQDERQLRCKDGRLIYAEITITEIKNDTGLTTSQVIVIRDITRRKQDQAQLERHNQELVMLGKIGQTVVTSLDLETIFNRVINQVMPLLQAECFSIALLKNDQLVYVANGGSDIEAMLNRTIPADEGILGQVMQTGEAVFVTASGPTDPLVGDIGEICYCEPRTLIAVPLKVENETIGIIQAAHRQTNIFDIDALRILQTAANWAAIAISRARKHEEIQRRLQETATLAAVNQSLNEMFDLDNILQLIADSTPQLLPNVDRVVIHLLEAGNTMLYPAIWSGQSHNDVPPLHMSSKEGVAGQALITGKLINVPNVSENPHYLPYPLSTQFKSLMVAPLQSGVNQLGTISVHCVLQENAFTLTDERLLMRFAESAAIAISTAKLYQAERHQRQFAESLAQAAAALSLSLNLSEIIQTILGQTLLIVTKCEKAAIFLLKEGDVYFSRSTDDRELPQRLPETLHRIFVRRDARTSPPAELVAETGKPILITETDDEPNWPNEAGSDWMRSFVAAPLRIRNEIIGFLNVHSIKLGAFDQETIRQVEALAAHASLAVHNATLFNELKGALQKEQSTRAQLVQAQKLSAIGRMVASVAHELNNPLQTIKNCLFLIQQDVEQDGETQTYIDMALSESKRLSNLVLQLREVYRPGSSGSKQPVSLNKLVDEVQLLLNQHLMENNVMWEQSLEPKEIVVNANANQLKQVFLNICLNGLEAMQPDGGTLSVMLFMDTETAVTGLSIQDTGPGIPPDSLTHIFEPFFTTKETGSGLGLAICYDIIQSHGGRIEVKSKQNQGATFTMWLPVVSQETVARQESVE